MFSAKPWTVISSTVILSIIHAQSFVILGDQHKLQPFEYGTKTSAMLDHICPAIELLKSTAAGNHVRCSMLCQEEQSCRSFFYSRDSHDCVLCSGHYYGISGLNPQQGMEYFRMVLPTWFPWSMWSACSKTCNGGTKTRTRNCSPHNRIPCTHSSETVTCNTYNCTISEAKTCTDWVAKGLEESATVQIDPLGTGPVEVVCNLTMEPGKAWTVMGHNQENRTYVHGFEAKFSYVISIVYNVGLEAATKVVDLSKECKQFAKWECYRNKFQKSCYWENRDRNRSSYFTGSRPPGKFCACGETSTCSNTTLECECDANDHAWRVDEGYVTNRNDLPITGFRAGDLGTRKERAYHTFGPLMCA